MWLGRVASLGGWLQWQRSSSSGAWAYRWAPSMREKFSPKAQEGTPTGAAPPSFDVSRSAVRYCLRHQLGYKWGKIRKKPRKRLNGIELQVQRKFCA